MSWILFRARNPLTSATARAYLTGMNSLRIPRSRQWNRRQFLVRSAVATGAVTLGLHAADDDATRPLRAAIMGCTGRGDYGHGLDVLFNGVPGVQVVGLSDPTESGREAAAKRAGAPRHYADYREMLAKEKPQLVSIASRWSEHHHAMGMAALQAGAHIYMEKPVTPTLAEADELIATARKAGLEFAVAHHLRLAPGIVHLKRRMDEGLIGDLLQIRSWGKQDARAGGEDMMVLGTHLFDLMRLYAGDPVWCTAQIRHEGREFTKADARLVKEQIGPVGGTEIEAQFAFASGAFGTFTSRGKLRETLANWGMELIGTKGTVSLLMGVFPHVFLHEPAKWNAGGATARRAPLKDDPSLNLTAEQRGQGQSNRRVVDDWLEAIRTGREPVCSGENAMRALEMVMAVYHAGLAGNRASFPLPSRSHPLK